MNIDVSGMRVVYDLQQVPGQRVTSLTIRCLECEVPTYLPVEEEEIYNVLIGTFLIKGGDGYDVITNNLKKHIELSKF